MPDYLRWTLAIFACYRLAQFLPYDDGPGRIFVRLQTYLQRRAREHKGFWRNLSDAAQCPFCLGVWLAIGCVVLARWPSLWGDVALAWMGVAGAQAWLQQRRYE